MFFLAQSLQPIASAILFGSFPRVFIDSSQASQNSAPSTKKDADVHSTRDDIVSYFEVWDESLNTRRNEPNKMAEAIGANIQVSYVIGLFRRTQVLLSSPQ